jgi:hypothetical protein
MLYSHLQVFLHHAPDTVHNMPVAVYVDSVEASVFKRHQPYIMDCSSK